jgi:hypothetical protein
MTISPLTLPRVLLYFDAQSRHYEPGETLSGYYALEGTPSREVKAVEVSILWYSDGKGEEDLAVHYFDRLDPGAALVDLTQPRHFNTRLPLSPLSYAGVILKIRWCVRVRVFLTQGKDLFAEEAFELGSVPPGQEVEP